MALKKRLYLIAITLPDDLNRKVRLIKQQMADGYQSKHSLRLPAHITLQKPFHFIEEESLIRNLGTFKIDKTPFELELGGFGAFAPKVIYIAIKESEPLKELYRQLQKQLVSITGFETHWLSHTPFTPHITVAYRDLTRANFSSAWERYKDRYFNDRFTVATVDLWRHNGKDWEVINKFGPFQG